MAKPVTVTIDKVAEILRSVAELAELRVMVGIPSEKAGRRDGEINNAALGRIHETGAPEVNIPPRPFLVPGANSVRNEAAALLRKAGIAAMSGKKATVLSIMHAIGLLGQNAVRRKITEGPFLPLKDSTIAARKRAGFKGTKPLIRTAQLRSSISYVIFRRGRKDA